MSNEVKKEVMAAKTKAFYIKGVNINYSFKTLEQLARDNKVKIEEGDILVVDNEHGTKRKAFKKTKSGALIMYAMLLKDEFTELPTKSSVSLLDSFNYEK